MSPDRFDLARLHRDIDHERERRGLTWIAVSDEVGVSTSTIRRFATADDAEADGVLALVRWLGAPPETFVDASRRAGALLPAGDGTLRVDMSAIAAALGEPRRGRTRTTINRLVEAARRADVTISSLTRLAEA